HGHFRIENRRVRHQIVIQNVHLAPRAATLDHRDTGDLAAGARGGGYGDVRNLRLAEAHHGNVIIALAAVLQGHADRLGGIDDAAAADTDDDVRAQFARLEHGGIHRSQIAVLPDLIEHADTEIAQG